MKRIRSAPTTSLPHNPGTGLRMVGTRRGRGKVNMWETLAPFAKRAGYRTRGDLARALGISRGHFSRVLNGHLYFTEHLQHHITYLLDLAPAEINQAFGFPGMTPTLNGGPSSKGASGSDAALAGGASGLRIVGRPARDA